MRAVAEAAEAAVAARLGVLYVSFYVSHLGAASACLLMGFERFFRLSSFVGLFQPTSRSQCWPWLATSTRRARAFMVYLIGLFSDVFLTRVGGACGAAALALVHFLLRDKPPCISSQESKPGICSFPKTWNEPSKITPKSRQKQLQV